MYSVRLSVTALIIISSRTSSSFLLPVYKYFDPPELKTFNGLLTPVSRLPSSDLGLPTPVFRLPSIFSRSKLVQWPFASRCA